MDEPITPVPQDDPGEASGPKHHIHWWMIEAVSVVIVVVVVAMAAWQLGRGSIATPAANRQAGSTPSPSAAPSSEAAATTLTLSATKNYGDKYANGLLPVGDSKYTTSGSKKGYVYVCNANFVPAGQAGAQNRGPWFTNNNTQYDINKKSHIAGSVSWTPSLSVTMSGGKRVITTNDLPDHKTGVFPVAASDPSRAYDANPNTIKSQSLTYTLDGAPKAGDPSCVGGEVGVMLTGVALFDGFDAGGRDAGAWEIQDGCDGHPQDKGEYHYHTLSKCITTATVDTVIGYALDGFPITGPKVADNNILTTDDLDECHGITSQITLDGKKVTMYHYVMTQDFPYSVSCFRGTAIKAPGLPEGSGGGGAPTPPPSVTPPPHQGLPPTPLR
ncbi:MAG TPA: YHYH protein [Candidatus Saccharimonadia bacterium]|jgi:hypothetical protein|nr:YHYH protein [Candidatus Saccharimonadia bacterium]